MNFRMILNGLLVAGCILAAPAFASEIAQAARTPTVDLKVVTTCEKGNAIFKVTNMGSAWPKVGRLEITRSDDRKVVSNRMMRMMDGQQASFRVPLKKDGETSYEISVEPTWYSRAKSVDGRVSCK